MTDSRALGGAGEAAIGDQGNARTQLGIAGDSLSGVEHLGHSGTLGALIANDNGIAGLDLVRQDGVDGVLLAIERTGLKRGLEHLARNNRVLDDGALGGKVAVEDGDGAVGTKSLVKRANDVLALEVPFLQVAAALLVVTVVLKVLEVFAEGLAGDGHDIEVEHRLDLLHDARHAARIVEELRRPLTCGANVEQVVGATVQAIEVVGGHLDAKLAGNRGDMQQRVGGARNGTVDHNEVLEGPLGHDVARAQVVFGEPHGLTAGLARKLTQIGAGCGQQGRAGEHKAQGLGGNLHGRRGAHKRAGTAAGACVVLGKLKLLARDLAALVAGRNRAELFQGQQIGTGIHDTAGNDDGGDVDAAHGHEVRRQALIAAGDKDAGVERGGLGMDLDHVGDHVAAGQRVVNAVVALGLAVADIGAEVTGTVTASLVNASTDLLDQLKQTGRTRVRVAERRLDNDLRLVQILDGPARAQTQRVHLGADGAKLAGTRLQLGNQVGGLLLNLCLGFLVHDVLLFWFERLYQSLVNKSGVGGCRAMCSAKDA